MSGVVEQEYQTPLEIPPEGMTVVGLMGMRNGIVFITAKRRIADRLVIIVFNEGLYEMLPEELPPILLARDTEPGKRLESKFMAMLEKHQTEGKAYVEFVEAIVEGRMEDGDIAPFGDPLIAWPDEAGTIRLRCIRNGSRTEKEQDTPVM
jgi:hypothetical protein